MTKEEIRTNIESIKQKLSISLIPVTLEELDTLDLLLFAIEKENNND